MAEEWTVHLPAGAEPPFSVWVNGEPREEGRDWRATEGAIVFSVPIRVRPERMGAGRRLMLLAGIGVYGDLKGDSVDVQYRAGGETRLATGLKVTPPAAAPG